MTNLVLRPSEQKYRIKIYRIHNATAQISNLTVLSAVFDIVTDSQLYCIFLELYDHS